MKSEFISKEKQAQAIDWSKPQIFKSKVQVGLVVGLISTGLDKECFEGVVLNPGNTDYGILETYEDFERNDFIPCEPGEQVILTA